jgi:hypothetical protein
VLPQGAPTVRHFFGCIYHFFYHIYAEIVTCFIQPLDERSLPPVPCQFCGRSHSEKYCPKAKEMGL